MNNNGVGRAEQAPADEIAGFQDDLGRAWHRARPDLDPTEAGDGMCVGDVASQPRDAAFEDGAYFQLEAGIAVVDDPCVGCERLPRGCAEVPEGEDRANRLVGGHEMLGGMGLHVALDVEDAVELPRNVG